MKQVCLLPLLAALLAIPAALLAQENGPGKNKLKEEKVKVKGNPRLAVNLAYPYVATYSSHFEMGNPAFAKTVLDLWKGYDENNWEVFSGVFADTAMAVLADGTTIKGKEDLLKFVKDYRSRFSSVKSTVTAWLAVRSVDRKEDLVSIWGREEDTHPDGKVTTVVLNEVWRFNKEGKVDMVRTFAQQVPKK